MPFILREEHKVRMFDNKMPKKIKRGDLLTERVRYWNQTGYESQLYIRLMKQKVQKEFQKAKSYRNAATLTVEIEGYY